ncbi:MAG: hypothetical protein ACFBSD_06800 [Paracoccaceae bacterium]
MVWRHAARLRTAGFALLCLAGAAACGGPIPIVAPREAAQSHPEKRFLVTYGDERFTVNVRYVEIIGETVIAVRQVGTVPVDARFEPMAVTPQSEPPEAANFADDAYRAVAVEVADAIVGRPPICVDGQTMRLARKDDEAARTLYRRQQRAWIVFAFCPTVEG